MIFDERITAELKAISTSETARLEEFLSSHRLREVPMGSTRIPCYSGGEGPVEVLTLAGGWGGAELLYETILGLESECRVLAADVSDFGHPKSLSGAVDRVLDAEGAGRVVLVGQSMSGILGQVYFRENPSRIRALVLINTIAPRRERCKRWALVLTRITPFPVFRMMMKKSLSRLSRREADVPAGIEERIRFKNTLISRIIERSASKARIQNALELAYRFNERGAWTADKPEGWTGRLHLITSRDDPYYPDIELFEAAFPRATRFEFPPGYGHVAPQVFRDELFAEIRRFIRDLE